ncbi:fatty-acid amide hydrolase 1-like isoform X1 [Kogia breviceps]|uniref:fatty-acid amide hydrolase 1-like isoform X1 n=1 Tax=Kogia breviceps TaxID=27615 RepID=UPI0034D25A81
MVHPHDACGGLAVLLAGGAAGSSPEQDPRAQKRGAGALQQMAALARLGQQARQWGSPEQKGCGVPASLHPLCAATTAAGPMARDVKSLVLCLRALLTEDVHPLDPTVPPCPSGKRSSSPLTPVQCAFLHLYGGGLFADGGATLLEKLKGDAVDPNMKDVFSQLRLPDPLKCFLVWMLKYTAGVALWFLKSVSPSLPTSGSPGLPEFVRDSWSGVSSRVSSGPAHKGFAWELDEGHVAGRGLPAGGQGCLDFGI